MAQVDLALRRHVSSRWSRWLRPMLLKAGMTPTALAAELRRRALERNGNSAVSNVDIRDSAPRGMVRAWLNGGYATADSVFSVGQILARKFDSVDGLQALFASGHYTESISLVYEFFVDSLRAASMIIHSTSDEEPVERTPDEIRIGIRRVEYILRFVGSAHTALADLDDVRSILARDRDEAFARIGGVNLNALEAAWEQRCTKLPVNIQVDPLREKYDGLYAASLIAWCALIEMITQHVVRSQFTIIWSEQERIWRSYLDRAHAEMMTPIFIVKVNPYQ